jgi:addiction module RelE/StbE family toxin
VKRHRVVWAEVARGDLEGIVSYLANESPQMALQVLDRLERRAATLATMAKRGRVVPELGRLHVREYRELIVAPYRLVYRATESEVVVLAVLDARRNLEDVLLDRLIRLSDGEG